MELFGLMSVVGILFVVPAVLFVIPAILTLVMRDKPYVERMLPRGFDVLPPH